MPSSLNNFRRIVLLAHDIRSTHNVGSLFRTAEGLGVEELILSGYTPYPKEINDERLAHVADKLDRQITKTALGAQKSLKWSHCDQPNETVLRYRQLGYRIFGLEQTDFSKNLLNVKPPNKVLIIVGNELSGLDEETIKLCDRLMEIPMLGKKESFNVVQATAMTLFYFRFC